LPTNNTFSTLNTGALPDWDYNFGTIIDRFSGGVYNPYWGAYGGMVFHGGGHASTYDNSVLILDYNDLTFKRLSDASPQSTFTDAHDDPLFNHATCEFGDGQPGGGHSFDLLAIIPPEDGGAPAGTLVRPTSHGVHVRISCSTGWAHRFDMDPNVARGRWERASTNAGVPGFLNPGATSAYDPVRKRIWWSASLSQLPWMIRYFDVAAREQRHIEYAFAQGAERAPPANPDSMTMRYDPVRDLLILTVTWQGNLRIAYLRCSAPQAGWFTPTLSSQIPSLSTWSHPFDYVPEIDRFIMLAPADNGAVYEIAVPTDPTQTWTVTRRPFTGLATVPVSYVTGKRWSYSPAVKAFVWLPRSDASVYVYRPVGV
jgi:hypothetical protein